jgi:hypothetical protein
MMEGSPAVGMQMFTSAFSTRFGNFPKGRTVLAENERDRARTYYFEQVGAQQLTTFCASSVGWDVIQKEGQPFRLSKVEETFYV